MSDQPIPPTDETTKLQFMRFEYVFRLEKHAETLAQALKSGIFGEHVKEGCIVCKMARLHELMVDSAKRIRSTYGL